MTKVFPPQGIDGKLKAKLDKFLDEQDFPTLYKCYHWDNDSYDAGFPEILKLEIQLTSHAKAGGVTEGDIRDVARWGMPNADDEDYITIRSKLSFQRMNESLITYSIDESPEYLAYQLCNAVNRILTVRASKVLRFALPEHFGAIDRRCIYVFGMDGLKWISLSNRNKDNHDRLREYKVWVNILRYFSYKLQINQISCPHPKEFADVGLRDSETWMCADVEMALFTYATHILDSLK